MPRHDFRHVPTGRYAERTKMISGPPTARESLLDTKPVSTVGSTGLGSDEGIMAAHNLGDVQHNAGKVGALGATETLKRHEEKASSPDATGDNLHRGHDLEDHVMIRNAHPHQSRFSDAQTHNYEHHGFQAVHVVHNSRGKGAEHHPPAGLEDRKRIQSTSDDEVF